MGEGQNTFVSAKVKNTLGRSIILDESSTLFIIEEKQHSSQCCAIYSVCTLEEAGGTKFDLAS